MLQLTGEVDLLGFDLCGDEHGDLVKFVLETFDLGTHVFDCLCRRLLIKVRLLLIDNEVDFL